jgi:aryl-alcohol dehydrogenase-like predicted oxidoreductase
MPDLPKRQLGRTGLQVTMLGYGAMELRDAPRGRPVDSKQAGAVLNAVLDSGINYIDTSPDYGKSEEYIGEHISNRRSEYYLASKCGCLVGATPAPPGERNPHVFTRENIIAGVEQSLRRMKTDYLDVVQFHASPSQSTLEQEAAIDVLRDLQQQGKIRFLGMSGTLPNIVDHVRMGVFDVFQIPYSALQREHEEVVSAASNAGSGIVIRGGAAQGGPRENRASGAHWDGWKLAGLDDLLEDGMTPVEFVLRFTFSNPDMDTNIVGTQNLDHLRNNVAIAEKGPLPEYIFEEAKLRLTAAGMAPTRIPAKA